MMPETFTEETHSTASHRMRWVLLVLSILFLAAGVFLKIAPGVEAGSGDFGSGALFKVGMVVGLAWLAAPQLERLGWQRLRGTGLAIIVVIGALTAVRPKFGAIAAGIAIGGFGALAMLGWVRGVIFSGEGHAIKGAKRRKIEKNPTRR